MVRINKEQLLWCQEKMRCGFQREHSLLYTVHLIVKAESAQYYIRLEEVDLYSSTLELHLGR
ncbi:hypothetical protein C5167_004024 [Papaver somniferum]|nr:hypothetical protein C5167_004024 [Papaver somniferum]